MALRHNCTSLEVKNRQLQKILAEKDKHLAELKGLIEREDRFWITEAGKQRHTSGLRPDMVQMMEVMDRIIGNDEILNHFTRFHRAVFEEALAS